MIDVVGRLEAILDSLLDFHPDERSRPGRGPAAPTSDGTKLARVSVYVDTLIRDLMAERAALEAEAERAGKPGESPGAGI